MIGYLGGDSDTYASRRGNRGDLTFTVEWPDHNRMLVITVMQGGEVCLAWTATRNAPPVRELEYIGHAHGVQDGAISPPWFELFRKPSTLEVSDPIVEFLSMPQVGNEEDDDYDD